MNSTFLEKGSVWELAPVGTMPKSSLTQAYIVDYFARDFSIVVSETVTVIEVTKEFDTSEFIYVTMIDPRGKCINWFCSCNAWHHAFKQVK